MSKEIKNRFTSTIIWLVEEKQTNFVVFACENEITAKAAIEYLKLGYEKFKDPVWKKGFSIRPLFVSPFEAFEIAKRTIDKSFSESIDYLGEYLRDKNG